MRSRTLSSSGKIVGVAALAAFSTAACGIGLEALPLPAPSLGDTTYTVEAVFDNALNLPTKAKVKLVGANVGEVETMVVENYHAVVTMRIMEDVELPVGTRAELRSSTPLGDVFVALQPPADTPPLGAMMVNGDRIPVAATTAAATIEELLTTASLLVNGGAIRNVTNLVNGLGSSVGGKGDQIAAMVEDSTRLLDSLVARSDIISNALTQTSQISAMAKAELPGINGAIEAAAPALSVLADNTDQALTLISEISEITNELAKFPSIKGTGTRGLIADINRISAELNNAATSPDASLAEVNRLLAPIMKIAGSTSAHVDADWEQLVVGAVSVPGHVADPGSRLPDGSDVDALVGTLTYTLLRIQDRVNGPGR